MSHHRTANRVLFAAALLVLLGVWPAVFIQLTRAAPDPAQVSMFANPAFAIATGSGRSIADIAEQAVDSVVSIHVRSMPNAFGASSEGGGSGVIVSDDGLIVTNNHVIDGMRELNVTLSDGRRFAARVIGGDRDSDLAVLKLEGDPRKLKSMKLGNSNDLRLGEVVLAIGNPFGVGQTVTMGIVSAKDRNGFIQTDAAINPGNSGGALVNMKGELIGINSMIFSRSGGNDGIGFAIPSNTGEPIIRELLTHGRVSKPWLGVSIQTVDQRLADGLGLDAARGVLIGEAFDGGPAQAAGLRRGDVIVEVNGTRTDTSEELQQAIAKAGVGAKVDVNLVRDGRKLQLQVELGDRTAPVTALPAPRANATDSSGLSVAPLDGKARQRYRVPAAVREGVVVTDVAPDSSARWVGIRPGDVIVEVNRAAVNSPRAFTQALERSGRRIALLVARGGAARYVVIER